MAGPPHPPTTRPGNPADLHRAALGHTGLTSNPTIFDKAIEAGSDYDADIATWTRTGASAEEVFFELALIDLRRAADLFAPVHEHSGGVDGWVSLEVSPLLAHPMSATIAQAKALHAKAARPNVFIKIPGTPEGLPAIEGCTFAGVTVNVTLLFSPGPSQASAEAYLRDIERRVQAGLDPAVHSVGSVFVSRWATGGPQPVHRGQTTKAATDNNDVRTAPSIGAGIRHISIQRPVRAGPPGSLMAVATVLARSSGTIVGRGCWCGGSALDAPLLEGNRPMPEQAPLASMYHPTTQAVSARRKELAPGIHDAFEAFSSAVFAAGALDEKTKQLIAVAVAHVTQCPYCIRGHSQLAQRKGAAPEQIMEAIWVAAEMRAGGAYAHAPLALEAIGEGHQTGS